MWLGDREADNHRRSLSGSVARDLAQESYSGNLWASSGQASYNNGTVTWSGEVSSAAPVTVRFDVTNSDQITGKQAIINTASLNDGQGNVLQRQAVVIVNGALIYLPEVSRGSP